jgi:hypothetical protein
MSIATDQGDGERSFQDGLELLSNLIYLARLVKPGSQLQQILWQAGKGSESKL